jgi:hypothetical protein
MMGFNRLVLGEDWEDTIASGVITAFIIFFFSFLLVSLVSSQYIRDHAHEYTWHTEEIGSSNIKTLSDGNDGLSGSFLLGCGTISTYSKYYYYKSTSDSTFYLGSINADGVKIIESDYRGPCIVKYRAHIDWSRSNFESNWFFKNSTQAFEYYEIYVPKNTIIINYNLDTQ